MYTQYLLKNKHQKSILKLKNCSTRIIRYVKDKIKFYYYAYYSTKPNFIKKNHLRILTNLPLVLKNKNSNHS